MIPRTIHYCWFGRNPLPKLAKQCIESWKKYCPDYEIVCWDESNFDVNYNQFTQDAYRAGKWAFVSDVARLYIVYHHGGIYLDTDVELIKSLDAFLPNKAFMGTEPVGQIATGLGFGAEKGMEVIREMLEEYDRKLFSASNPLDCPKMTTAFLTRYGYSRQPQIQTVRDITIYPPEYFGPADWVTGKLHKTSDTAAIHHYLSSWTTKHWKYKKKIRKLYCFVLGERRGMRVYSSFAYIGKKARPQKKKDGDS